MNTQLTDELRAQLLESAAWGKAGITPVMNEEAEATVEEDAPEAEELEEAKHVCPLCTSHLDEQISEDTLLEHLDIVMGLVDRLSQINEGDDDADEIIDAALEDLLLGTAEEEEE
tara:strand:- start:5462 stop:5806 length:345 start_codon:yes stop_codon:yes gene_type:complete